MSPFTPGHGIPAWDAVARTQVVIAHGAHRIDHTTTFDIRATPPGRVPATADHGVFSPHTVTAHWRDGVLVNLNLVGPRPNGITHHRQIARRPGAAGIDMTAVPPVIADGLRAYAATVVADELHTLYDVGAPA